MRRRSIVKQRTEEAKAALLQPKEEPKNEEVQRQETPPQQERKVLGPKQLCPRCGKVPARYFHVKHCKGQ